ncbi:hypothetical protein [Streptomyces tardus]|nr:hypothetical protein [Streptomyces tardus]
MRAAEGDLELSALPGEVDEGDSEIGVHPRTGAPQVTFLPPTG